jgi:HEAT repeat protein
MASTVGEVVEGTIGCYNLAQSLKPEPLWAHPGVLVDRQWLANATGGLQMGILDSILKINIDEMKAERDLNGLFKALNNKRNIYVRMDAARALGEMGDPAAMEPLIAALNDSKKDVRDAAAVAIGKLGGDPRAVEVVAGKLKSDKSIERGEATLTLGQIRHESGVGHLVPALGDKDFFVRESAVVALGRIGHPSAVEALGQALKDEDKDVRRAAVAALEEIGGGAAEEVLVGSLKDESPMIRCKTAEALGRIGGPGAVAPLIEALKDGGWIGSSAGGGRPGSEKAWVREKAIEALAEIGDARAVAPVTEALNDKQEPVREAARKALQKLGANATG